MGGSVILVEVEVPAVPAPTEPSTAFRHREAPDTQFEPCPVGPGVPGHTTEEYVSVGGAVFLVEVEVPAIPPPTTPSTVYTHRR